MSEAKYLEAIKSISASRAFIEKASVDELQGFESFLREVQTDASTPQTVRNNIHVILTEIAVQREKLSTQPASGTLSSGGATLSSGGATLSGRSSTRLNRLLSIDDNATLIGIFSNATVDDLRLLITTFQRYTNDSTLSQDIKNKAINILRLIELELEKRKSNVYGTVHTRIQGEFGGESPFDSSGGGLEPPPSSPSSPSSGPTQGSGPTYPSSGPGSGPSQSSGGVYGAGYSGWTPRSTFNQDEDNDFMGQDIDMIRQYISTLNEQDLRDLGAVLRQRMNDPRTSEVVRAKLANLQQYIAIELERMGAHSTEESGSVEGSTEGGEESGSVEPSPNPSSESEGMSARTIALIVAIVAVVLLIIGGGVYIYQQRKLKRSLSPF